MDWSISLAFLGLVTTTAVSITSMVLNARGEKRRGEQDDRHRVEDRAWSVRERNADQREATYTELLALARRVIVCLGAHQPRLAFPIEETEITRARTSSIDAFSEKVAEVTLKAVDWSVLELAERFLQRAQRSETGYCITGYQELAEACRRDLGYDTERPVPPPVEWP